MMMSFRKWAFKPRLDDWSALAKFYYADEALNTVAAELDSFDGRKDQERCSQLVQRLRNCQDKVLQIIEEMLQEIFMNDAERAPRDYRVKFPDDILQENLAGQLWFGAECLAAGSNIIDHEFESEAIRPLARSFVVLLDKLRDDLKEQCLKNPTLYPDKLKQMLHQFDYTFAEFELNYVSAMVPVKSVKEFDMQLDVAVLFSETLQRAIELNYITQSQIEDCDPSIMITLPRLAIVCGLIIFSDGPLNVDKPPDNLSELFRPFQSLLIKIRELLQILEDKELETLERSLCRQEEIVFDPSQITLVSDYQLSKTVHVQNQRTRKRINGKEGSHKKKEKILLSSSNNKLETMTAESEEAVSSEKFNSSIDDTDLNQSRGGKLILSNDNEGDVLLCTSDKLSNKSTESTESSGGSDDVSTADDIRLIESLTTSDDNILPPNRNKQWQSFTYFAGSNVMMNQRRFELRRRFKSAEDLIHRLFVCISGVADQLQSNHPADLRKVLKMVFQPQDLPIVYEFKGSEARNGNHREEMGDEVTEETFSPESSIDVPWVPDSECSNCIGCQSLFTIVRRRHHCRNCGQIFCGRCSANELPLPKLGYHKPVRVCNRCFIVRLNPFTPATSHSIAESAAVISDDDFNVVRQVTA